MLTLIDIPSAASLFATTGAYASTTFNELLPIGLTVVGMIVGALIVLFIGHGILDAIGRIAFTRKINRDFDRMSVEELEEEYKHYGE